MLMCTQTNMHTLQLALCGGGGGRGVQIYINTLSYNYCNIILISRLIFCYVIIMLNDHLYIVATHLWYSSIPK